MIKFHNIDCMEFMRKVPDKYYDLAVVDPPYGINADRMKMGTHLSRKGDGYPAESVADRIRKKGRLNSGGGKLRNRVLNNSNCEWDSSIPTAQYFQELCRISQTQVIWGGNYFPLPPSRCILCWDKLQPWENFSQFELAWTSFDSPAAMFRYSNTGGANLESKIHPTQKPIALYSWIFNLFAKKSARSGVCKIIDTHLGSGSSAIAALKWNRFEDVKIEFDGCEIDADYFAAARKRFDEHEMQPELFGEKEQPKLEGMPCD